jgi:hypothetical protein
MPERETFETIVKRYVDAGADVSTAFGKAITDDPAAYGRYLKDQKKERIKAAMARYETRRKAER